MKYEKRFFFNSQKVEDVCWNGLLNFLTLLFINIVTTLPNYMCHYTRTAPGRYGLFSLLIVQLVMSSHLVIAELKFLLLVSYSYHCEMFTALILCKDYAVSTEQITEYVTAVDIEDKIMFCVRVHVGFLRSLWAHSYTHIGCLWSVPLIFKTR
jgi:hypothetical protein